MCAHVHVCVYVTACVSVYVTVHAYVTCVCVLHACVRAFVIFSFLTVYIPGVLFQIPKEQQHI